MVDNKTPWALTGTMLADIRAVQRKIVLLLGWEKGPNCPIFGATMTYCGPYLACFIIARPAHNLVVENTNDGRTVGNDDRRVTPQIAHRNH